MKSAARSTTFSASAAMASVFGTFAGLGGLTHGIGEILQGNVAPTGIFVNSWTVGPIATNMGGEPAMTLVPNLLVTGILTIIVSAVLLVWSIALVRRRNSGRALLLLSLAMFLVGGGFAPPILGVFAGLAGLGIGARHTWWRARLSIPIRRFLAEAWRWIYAAALVNGFFLVIGSVILVYFYGLNQPSFFVNSFLAEIVLALLSLFLGIVYDVQNTSPAQPS